MAIPDARFQALPRAVILTALPVEFRTARAYLKSVRDEWHPEGTPYARGVFTSKEGSWEVLLVETGRTNTSAALEAERAIRHFSPDVALFVGVAGGLKDVNVGDVVAASKVYGYESGKAQRRFEPRPEVSECSYALEQQARAVARNGAWMRRIVGGQPRRAPQAVIGPIAAGEKVVADTRSPTHRFLRAHYSDALAVDMEGRGFLAAVRANRGVRALVIRGISDCIDSKAEADASGSQEIAAWHASAFAYEVLAGVRPSAHRSTRDALPRDGFAGEILRLFEVIRPTTSILSFLTYIASLAAITFISQPSAVTVAILAAVAVFALLRFGNRSMALEPVKPWVASSLATGVAVVGIGTSHVSSRVMTAPESPTPVIAAKGSPAPPPPPPPTEVDDPILASVARPSVNDVQPDNRPVAVASFASLPVDTWAAPMPVSTQGVTSSSLRECWECYPCGVSPDGGALLCCGTRGC